MTQTPFDRDFWARLGRLRWIAARARSSGHGAIRGGGTRGGLVEIAGHRRYVQGDDTRTVDWSVYARLEKLFVKVFDKEEHVPVTLVLDASGSMDLASNDGVPGVPGATKGELARELVAALAFVALAGENPVRFYSIGPDGVGPPREIRRLAELSSFLSDLAAVDFDGSARLGDGIDRIVGQLSHASLFVLFSDLLEDREVDESKKIFERLIHARARRHDVAVVHLVTQEELDPRSYLGGAGSLELIDVETGAGLRMPVGVEEIDRYCRLVAESHLRCRTLAGRHRIRYQLVRSDARLEDVVLEFLRRGGFLR